MTRPILKRTCILVGFALGLSAAPAAAQAPIGAFVVTPMGGYGVIDASSALESMVSGGLDVMYRLANGATIGLGGGLARTQTRERFFPPVRLVFGQVTELHDVQQPVLVYNYRAQVGYYRERGRLDPYLLSGVGGYLLYTDAEQSRGSKVRHKLHVSFGGGIDWAVEPGSGVRLDIRDLVYLGWDREFLNPVAPEFRDDFVPEVQPVPPAPKRTIHTILISLGFSFVP
ncbi:MAG: outer membrane beta-barrel protein [Gemmatimonadetes bacterium]|nr:outer membrane beta-barrel protein [Gemmatimonadota bacterium]